MNTSKIAKLEKALQYLMRRYTFHKQNKAAHQSCRVYQVSDMHDLIVLIRRIRKDIKWLKRLDGLSTSAPTPAKSSSAPVASTKAPSDISDTLSCGESLAVGMKQYRALKRGY